VKNRKTVDATSDLSCKMNVPRVRITIVSGVYARKPYGTVKIMVVFLECRPTDAIFMVLRVLLYLLLEISTRGHEYEKGYIIKNWLPSLGDNFLVNNNVDAKSDIPSLEYTYYVYVWKVWCKSGQFF
jgi:hypothetical protein